MSVNKEILEQIEGKIPKLDSSEAFVFSEWEASGEDLEGINLLEVDRESGRLLKMYSYQGKDFERVFDEEGYIVGVVPKSFRLNEVTEFNYQPLAYTHPLLDRQFEVVVQEVRSWDTDKLARKIGRDTGSRQIIIFDDFWDPKEERPRRYQVLVGSDYEPIEKLRARVSDKVRWIEEHRSFLFSNAIIIYRRNADGLMMLEKTILSASKHPGIEYPPGLSPRLEVGQATFLDF